MPRKTIALVTAAVAVTLLAGCSSTQAGPAEGSSAAPQAPRTTAAAAPEQTEAEACALVEDRTQAFRSGATTPTTDAERVELVRSFTDQIDAVLPDITNDEVHDALSTFRDGADTLADRVESEGSASPESLEAFQRTVAQVSAVCD